MFNFINLKYKFINFLLRFLIKSKIIPENFMHKIKCNDKNSIIYILPLYSRISLYALRSQCKRFYLPDPLTTLTINGFQFPRCIFLYRRIKSYPYIILNNYAINLFHVHLNMYRKDININFLPSLIMLGRKGKKDLFDKKDYLNKFYILKKIYSVFTLGRNTFVYFFPIIKLNRIEKKYINNLKKIKKLARVTGIYFIRQYLIAISSHGLTRKKIFSSLMKSELISKTIQHERRIKKISYKQSRKQALLIFKEIAANFSYTYVRLTDYIMRWMLKKLYKNINVHGVKHIFNAAKSGNRIIYLPCHRSHMDYLLLSYILYHQGFMPPHIAAGINLNFFPVGIIFRNLGAFFIRRAFNANKLYTVIFREYLNFLFKSRCSIEYFIEGSRSRTGRLLEPKTGTLSIIVQEMLKSNFYYPVTIIPIYMGYEYVIEIDTYIKELSGQMKKKENFFHMIKSLKNLHNFGQSYINFGQPFLLTKYIKKYIEEKNIDIFCEKNSIKPAWSNNMIHHISQEIMTRINNAAAVNAVNLCALILLNAKNFSLKKNTFNIMLNFYLKLLNNVPYSADVTIINLSCREILSCVLKMNQLEIKKNCIGKEIVTLKNNQKISMSYYRNNIHHMLIFPSIMITVIKNNKNLTKMALLKRILIIYPMLKNEFFLTWKKKQISNLLDKFLNEFLSQNLLSVNQNQFFCNNINKKKINMLSLNVLYSIYRYIIIFFILITHPNIKQHILKIESIKIFQKLLSLYHFKGLEYFDKSIFKILFMSLKKEGYFINTEIINLKKVKKTYALLSTFINEKRRCQIEKIIFEKINI